MRYYKAHPKTKSLSLTSFSLTFSLSLSYTLTPFNCTSQSHFPQPCSFSLSPWMNFTGGATSRHLGAGIATTTSRSLSALNRRAKPDSSATAIPRTAICTSPAICMTTMFSLLPSLLFLAAEGKQNMVEREEGRKMRGGCAIVSARRRALPLAEQLRKLLMKICTRFLLTFSVNTLKGRGDGGSSRAACGPAFVERAHSIW